MAPFGSHGRRVAPSGSSGAKQMADIRQSPWNRKNFWPFGSRLRGDRHPCFALALERGDHLVAWLDEGEAGA